MPIRLVISDVDSTLIEQEVIDQLADEAGQGAQVSSITARAMAGELDFKEALIERVRLLSGLPESVFGKVAQKLSLSPGASELREFCKNNGILFGAVSGGFTQVLTHLEFFRNLDYLATNNLEVKEGLITGRVMGPIVDREGKAEHLRRFAITHDVDLSETLAIGDGANDLLMIKEARIGVAYKAKQILRDNANLVIEDDLRDVIEVLRR
jgi:phosphoserine phosphatase